MKLERPHYERKIEKGEWRGWDLYSEDERNNVQYELIALTISLVSICLILPIGSLGKTISFAQSTPK